MTYNQSFFANKVVESWLIPSAKTGAKSIYLKKVDLFDNGKYLCSCGAKSECVHIKKAREWQENEKKGYQF